MAKVAQPGTEDLASDARVLVISLHPGTCQTKEGTLSVRPGIPKSLLALMSCHSWEVLKAGAWQAMPPPPLSCPPGVSSLSLGVGWA